MATKNPHAVALGTTTYTVTVMRTITLSYTVEVEAASVDAAKKTARNLAEGRGDCGADSTRYSSPRVVSILEAK